MKKLFCLLILLVISFYLYVKDHTIKYEVKGKGKLVILTIIKSKDDSFEKRYQFLMNLILIHFL